MAVKVSTSEDLTVAGAVAPVELHGRRPIYTNVTEINRANVRKVLNDALSVHIKNRTEEQYLERYLRGIQPILARSKVYNDYVCNRTVVNIANEIVTFKTAEFAGEPIQYVSRGSKKSIPKKLEKLNAMMISEGKQSKDLDLAYKMFTNGVAYRLVLNDKAKPYADGELFDEAPFEIYIPEPRNTFVVRVNDVSSRVIMGVTYVYLDDTHVQYTVYTKDSAYKLEGTNLRANEIVDVSVHNLGIVPLVEYPCNSIRMSPIEVVHDLLNSMNLVLSDRLDGVEQFIQALMVFEGVDITREDFLELKDLGAIKLPPAMDGRTSRVYYLSEQLDQGQTQTLVDDMYQTILHIVGMPSQGNGNTGDSSNNGAVILKNGWWSAEARAQEVEGNWRASETEFLKIVLKICADSNALTNLAVSDVQCKFGRRSYQDLLTKTQSFTTLMGANVPPLQAYKYSALDTDPEAAAIQYEAYQEQRRGEQEASLMEEINRARTAAVQTVRSGSVSSDEESDTED